MPPLLSPVSSGKMISAYWKDTFREIKKSPGRYFSLVIITALGAAAVIGILASSIDMRAIADKTYKERSLYDIQIKSTTGFTDDDISALRGIPGVGIVMPANTFDAYICFGKETHTIRAHALPDELNKIELTSGRLPGNERECAVEQAILQHRGLSIGDTITLGLDDMEDYFDVISRDEFTITGVVVSPFFIIPHDRGNTSLGDGRLEYYIYLHPDAFVLDVYTDVYILMEESRDMDNLTAAYNEAAGEWSSLAELTGDVREQVKADEFSDIQKEIDDGWQEYHDGVEELDEKIADGRKELDDAKTELEEALDKLDTAKTELEDAQATLADEIAEALA